MPVTRHALPRAALRLFILIASTTGLIACASNPPPPSQQILISRTVVNQAETAGAREFAPLELSRAKEKLRQAEEAAKAERNLLARYLAEEAEVDATLASTKARSERARQAQFELEQGLETLRQELDRQQQQLPSR